jgi:hypothetical protein
VVSGCRKGLVDGDNTDLTAVRADYANLPGANVSVDVDAGIVWSVVPWGTFDSYAFTSNCKDSLAVPASNVEGAGTHRICQ